MGEYISDTYSLFDQVNFSYNENQGEDDARRRPVCSIIVWTPRLLVCLLDRLLGEGGCPLSFNSTGRSFASFDSNYIPDVYVLATLRDSNQFSKLSPQRFIVSLDFLFANQKEINPSLFFFFLPKAWLITRCSITVWSKTTNINALFCLHLLWHKSAWAQNDLCKVLRSCLQACLPLTERRVLTCGLFLMQVQLSYTLISTDDLWDELQH